MNKLTFNEVVDADGMSLNGINVILGDGKILSAVNDDDSLLLIEDLDKHPIGVKADSNTVVELVMGGHPFVMLTFKNVESVDLMLRSLMEIKEKLQHQESNKKKLQDEIEKLYAERNSLEKKMTELSKEIEEKAIELYHEKKSFTKNSTPCSEI